MESREDAFQPIWRHDGIIIHENNDVAPSAAKANIPNLSQWAFFGNNDGIKFMNPFLKTKRL